MTETENEDSQPRNSQPDPLTIGELIGLAEAAQLSGLSPTYLRDIARNGRLKAKKVGRDWLTTLAAIEEYKDTRAHILKKEE
jgi:excisionase family DNA binding protein